MWTTFSPTTFRYSTIPPIKHHYCTDETRALLKQTRARPKKTRALLHQIRAPSTQLCIMGTTWVVSDVANIFACNVGMPITAAAITLVAVGTSLPDTFASRLAAVNDLNADASITNVTGSNCVNVFLGIGLPWTMAAIFWNAQGCPFPVPAGELWIPVVVFSINAIIAIAFLNIRRRTFGGELGGKKLAKWGSFAFMVGLWVEYIIIALLLG